MQMKMRQKKIRRTAATLAAALLLLLGSVAPAYAAMPTALVPVGRAAGIRLAAEGVMVVRLSAVQTAAGAVYPAKQAGLREGDMLLCANDRAIDSNESLQKAVAAVKSDTVALRVRRGGSEQTITLHPVQDTAGDYKIGVMVRDSMAGIGTITYVDPATGAYGSLGHGISDTETGVLLPMRQGTVTEATVDDVKRGTSGSPGELHGSFNTQKDMGTVTKNTESGIYGVLTDDAYYAKRETVPVAQPGEVHSGAAEILCNVSGEQVKSYDAEIVKVFPADDELGRCLLLHVTDEALLAKTGGIVQGMSGSPVLQDGKLVGAVTHVLVNDPTRGYAIFIETMLEEMTSAIGK